MSRGLDRKLPLYEVEKFGIMSSGIPSTSTSNSRTRQILHAESKRSSDLTARGPWYLNEDAELTQQTISLSFAMGDDLYGQGTMQQSDCQAARELGALIDEVQMKLTSLPTSSECLNPKP